MLAAHAVAGLRYRLGCWSAVLTLMQEVMKWSLPADPLGKRVVRSFLEENVRAL